MPSAVGGTHKSFMTQTTFESMASLIGQKSLMALQEAGLVYMTQVQESAIPIAVTGRDLIVKARTGTGKTLGFLIPSIERLHRNQLRVVQGKVAVLVISPTRELAMQTMKEARMLLSKHAYTVQCVMGGTNMNTETRAFHKGVDILVATPGRLVDHINNTKGVNELISSTAILVLDEADKLLEMGFKKDIDFIASRLPATGVRQTLLFSATMPDQLAKLVQNIVVRGYETIDTVGHGEETNVQVKQEYLISPLRDQIPLLYQMVKQHMASEPDYKIIVFFVTARLTQFMAALFNSCLGIPTLEIHSRKSQGNRTTTSQSFRNGKNVILFSSDVSARGVDYPDVTLVLQVGIPADPAQYVHRLGRTARAGKEGQGLLLLADFEAHFLRKLQHLPLSECQPKQKPSTYDNMAPELAAALGKSPGRRGTAHSKIQSLIPQTYQSWLGYYNGHTKFLGWSKPELVQQANELSAILGASQPPKLTAQCIGKMGLRGVPGLTKM